MTEPDWNYLASAAKQQQPGGAINQPFDYQSQYPSLPSYGGGESNQMGVGSAGGGDWGYFPPPAGGQTGQGGGITHRQARPAVPPTATDGWGFDSTTTQQWGDFSQPPPTQPPPPNYNNYIPQQFPVGAEPMLSAARHFGGQFAEQQREKFSKYVSSLHLKYYFAVDTSYVSRKLGIILFPFLHRDWTMSVGSGGEPVPARQDVNAPDLYIPLMGFITYVLVAGFVFGTQKRFSPEQLGMLTTNALFYMCVENALVFVAKYVLNISQSLNIWQSLSYTSYKYVGMVACLLLYLVAGSSVYYAGLIYCIITTIFFLLRSLKTFILDGLGGGYSSAEDGRKRKLYLLLSITAFQSLVMWLLTSSVTSYMPTNYDFAKMAMAGMGYSPSSGGRGKPSEPGVPHDAPRLPTGEVDYEALLKMS